MSIDISDVARIVAALPLKHRASFDLRVAKLQRDEAELKARAIATLRSMPDIAVVAAAMKAAQNSSGIVDADCLALDVDEAARVLREGGFVREERKLSITFIFPGVRRALADAMLEMASLSGQVSKGFVRARTPSDLARKLGPERREREAVQSR